MDKYQKTNANCFMSQKGLSSYADVHQPDHDQKLGKGKFMKYLGLLAMTCESKWGQIQVYRQVGDEPESVYAGSKLCQLKAPISGYNKVLQFHCHDTVGANDVS